MMTIDETIAVIQAYKEGKTIQYKTHTDLNWSTCVNPRWNFYDFMYRIKPEEPKPKYRPYESAEDVMEAIREHGSWIRNKQGFLQIVGISSVGCLIGHTTTGSFNAVFNDFTWPDGTPFGIKEE